MLKKIAITVQLGLAVTCLAPIVPIDPAWAMALNAALNTLVAWLIWKG